MKTAKKALLTIFLSIACSLKKIFKLATTLNVTYYLEKIIVIAKLPRRVVWTQNHFFVLEFLNL